MDTLTTVVEANKIFIAIFSSIIGWAGFLLVLSTLKNFIVTGISRAVISWLPHASGDTQRQVIKYLTDKPQLLTELYTEMKNSGWEANQDQQ